jgi:hypothetical protein
VGQLTLYFDRCFGKRLPQVVESAKPPFSVKSHFGEGFKHNAPDDEWLKIVGARGWIVLSYDARFHLDTPALAAIEQFKIGCFYLWGGQLPIWDKLGVLTRAFPKIRDKVNGRPKPFIFQVGAHGRVRTVKCWDEKRKVKAAKAAE